MYAIFHIEQPDGSVIATCESFPNFAIHIREQTGHKQAAERALLEHVQRSASFSHYKVPLANNHLKPVA